jgi:hypothetical protein
VKYASENCLKILCEGTSGSKNGSAQLHQYLAKAESETKRFLTDFLTTLPSIRVDTTDDDDLNWFQ